jgi:signal transduction histidine kinase
MNATLQVVAWAALLLAAIAVPVSALVLQPQNLDEPLDRIFMGQPLAWALAAVVAWLGLMTVSGEGYSLWRTLVYQAVCATAATFLLASASLLQSLVARGVTAYAVLGTVALCFGADTHRAGWTVQSPVMHAWMAFTVVAVCLALGGLLFKLHKDRSAATALVVVGAWWGWSLVVGDFGEYALAKLSNEVPVDLTLSASHVVFCAYLVALWLLFTGRIPWVNLRPAHVATEPRVSTGFASISGLDALSDAHGLQSAGYELAHAAVADERRRIAQDIHDGVGSQLVGLIASLNADLPAHRRIMLGLESCLLDLKTTVDNVDSTDDSATNIFDALGRLRYRFQPSLSRVGIRMHWKVDVAGPLISVKPSQLVHVVRIAQECLANVLLHSEAKVVQVKCCYEAAPVERMLLEILDNGIGIAKRSPDDVIGKGLSGMKERADRIGAELIIGSRPGAGTRIRLYLPLR